MPLVDVDAAHVSLALRSVLGWVFLISALDKLRQLGEFRETVSRYPGMREWLVRPISLLVPSAELVLATGLFVGLYWRWSAFGIAFLLALFSLAIAARSTYGSEDDCGCGGLLPERQDGRLHLAVNGVLFACAIGLFALPQTTAAVSNPWPTIMAGTSDGRLDGLSALIAVCSLSGLLSLAILAEIWKVRSLLVVD